MQTSPHSSHIVQAVFSVCASEDVASAAMTAVATVPGAEFIGEFQEYITADRRPQFSTNLKNASACVALIDCDRDPERALETMERLQQTFSNRVSLVAVAAQTDAGFLVRAMRVGCNGFLNKPLDPVEFASALTRFQSGHLTAALSAKHSGKIISFYGVKGGVGSSTLAVHLAMHLVRKHRKKVLLIDHKHELGHIALYLGIKESMYYFNELILNVDRLDTDLLQGFVTRHISGLEIIPSSDTCALPHEASPEAIERVMEYLRSQYDYVLIDTSMQYSSSLAPIMAASDEVSLISTPDIAALRDLVRHIEQLSLVKDFTSKLRVIVNRSTSEDAVNDEQIESAVRFPVSAAIPNNYADLMRAINAGEPISPQHRGGFSQAIAAWSNRLVNGSSSVISSPVAKKRFSFRR